MAHRLLISFLLAIALAAPAFAESRVIRAVPLAAEEVIRLDGALDENVWERAEAATGFVQQEPRQGDPATDRTEVRVAFDSSNLYLGVRCYQDVTRIVTTSLARDFKIEETDTFGFIVDPFDDDRNGFMFMVTPAGALREVQATNDGANTNENWNAVWDARVQHDPEGWTVEIVVPFKTLRFPGGAERWGVNFNRRVRHKNEVSFWAPVTRPHGISRVSVAGDVVGFSGLEPGRNLKISPYGLFRSTGRNGDLDQDLQGGLDLKYSVSTTTTLDLTLNTDFSEVETDTQQINLTRFPLFYPEKRPFFLESADLFHFGVRPNEKGGGATGEEFIGFFTRRIGLSPERTPLPLWGGARMTGRTGPYSFGVLHVTTREDETGRFPTANYSVARAKRNLLAQSDAGLLVMSRQGANGDFTRVVGADLNLQFIQRLSVTSFLAKSFSESADSRSFASKVLAAWTDPKLEMFGTWIDVGPDYDPSMSYVPRRDIKMFRGEINVRRRPKLPLIRELHPHVTQRYILNYDRELRTKKQHLGLWVYFHDGSRFEIYQQREFERLDQPFGIHRGIVLPVADYTFNSWVTHFIFNPTRRLSGAINGQWGEFWNGTLDSVEVRGAVRIRPRFVLEGRFERNRVRLRQGEFDTNLASVRVHHGFNTRQFVDMLVQYNSDDDVFSYQGRYNLIHRPLSDLFVVISGERDYLIDRQIRSFTVKFNRLLDF